ncbi:FeoA family protein [Ottowia thiooxydans]|uniref:FeoA family protein n=1 Tax=Ottowia thiooxydans TaxID=219182 RepID=UPI00041495B7|nr:FeoA family protein [Ottowia thiooxydans]
MDSAFFASSASQAVGDLLPLHALSRGERGVIEQMRKPTQDGDHEVLLRLLEIGFLPGEIVRVIAPSRRASDPVAVRIGQATFALRVYEAAFIEVRLVTETVGSRV